MITWNLTISIEGATPVMQNHIDEEVVRIVLFREDFSDAIAYFEKSKNIDERFVRDALIKMGIISYAKLFMKNTGIHKELKSFRLKAFFVPEEYQWLHKMLMDHRGNYIGHSNFKTIQPNMGEEESTPIGKMRPIHYGALNFDHWFEIDLEFPKELPLIEQVIHMATKIVEVMPKVYTSEEVFPNA